MRTTSKQAKKEKLLTNVIASFPNTPAVVKCIQLCYMESYKNNWRVWVDDFGYGIKIKDDKTINTIKNLPIQVRDMYYKETALWALENNQWSFVDNNIEIYLGHDNKLRLFQDGERKSTLILGWGYLKRVVGKNLIS